MKTVILWLKRLLKLALFLFLALLLVYAVVRPYTLYTDSLVEGERAPYFQMQSANAITIRWNTAEPEIGVLHYGLSINALNSEIKDEEGSEAHEFRLTQLQPSQRYYYAVGNTEEMKYGGGADDWFMTAPEIGVSDESVRFWVIGDSGQPGAIQTSVRDAMKAWLKENPRQGLQEHDKPYLDQWLALGDNAYRSGTNKQYQAALFDAYPDILKNIALWPIYGNHDARRWAFFDIFTLPEQAEAGGVVSGTENYYSFDFANIHYVILDSQDSDRETDGDMLNWLQRDLQANHQDWLIVAFHHPPYTKGSHNSDDEGDSRGRLVDMRQNVLPVLERYGVDLVLTGHSHVYERSYLMDCHYGDSTQFSEKNIVSRGVDDNQMDYVKAKGAHSGTIYVVAGASAKVDRGPMNHPAMEVSLMKAGSLIIDIKANTLIARYINVDAEVEDEFTIEKVADDSWKKYRNESYAACEL